MTPGRNEPCSCGSGKKYKKCCMDAIGKQHAEMMDEIAQTLSMSPELSLDEMNLVVQQRITQSNNRPNADFCGLTPAQMMNWLHAPFADLTQVTISPPDDLSTSPVMRYLELILDEAMQQEDSFKSTSKGNLPVKLVKQASALLPEFAVSRYPTNISISEFAGSNEDKFNALHYARILAEIAGVIYRKSGRFHVKKVAQKQYQTQGLQVFFRPMLEAAVSRYNWAYFDSFEQDVDLRTFWLFMLWRLQTHANLDILLADMCRAFPDLLRQTATDEYYSAQGLLGVLIESRFIGRFLQFWGFVTVDPRVFGRWQGEERKVDIQPLLTDAFKFSV